MRVMRFKQLLATSIAATLALCACRQPVAAQPAPGQQQILAAQLRSSPKGLVRQKLAAGGLAAVSIEGRWLPDGTPPSVFALRKINTTKIACRRGVLGAQSSRLEALAEVSTDRDPFDRQHDTTGFLSVRTIEYDVLEWSDVSITARSGSLDLRIFLDGDAVDRTLRYDTGPPENRSEVARWHLGNGWQ